MTPEQIEQLIRELLEAGKIVATKAFELSMKQVYTYAILDVVIGTIIFMLGLLIWWSVKRHMGSKYRFENDEGMIVVLSWIVSGFGLIIGLCSIRYFINPEWYAVKLLLETFIK